MEHAEESNGEGHDESEPGHNACAVRVPRPIAVCAIRACSETRERSIRAPSAFAVERVAASFRAVSPTTREI